MQKNISTVTHFAVLLNKLTNCVCFITNGFILGCCFQYDLTVCNAKCTVQCLLSNDYYLKSNL